jgi:hypothetical protein
MAHVRKLIRDNLKTALTGLTTTGSRVYQSRVYPLAAATLPGLLIYSKDEATEYQTIGLPRLQLRTVSFTVEAYVKGVSDYDDTLDQICLEVEESLYTNSSLGGYASDVMVTSFEADFNGDGDQPVSRATLTIEVQYQTLENDLEAVV